MARVYQIGGGNERNLAQKPQGFHRQDGVATMAESQKVFLVGPDGSTLAELLIADEEQGWFTGRVISHVFPSVVQNALAWYDQVVRDQMLSYLDEAAGTVQRLDLQASFPDGSKHKTYSLHVSPSNEVSFRINPVPPPPEMASPESTGSGIVSISY